MVMFRRNPFRTSLTTNPARMGSSRVPATQAGLVLGRAAVDHRTF
jgi:hypothetical protein